MYYTLKQKLCGSNDEMNIAGFDQYKYSRSSAKIRRTVICRISVPNTNKEIDQPEINQDIDDNHELKNLSSCSKKNDAPISVTYL